MVEVQIELDKIYNMDCVKGMALIPDMSVDLIVTDPPFAIDFSDVKSSYNRIDSRVLAGYKEVPKSDYLSFTHSWLEQAYRILSDTGSAFVFSGWNNLKDILIVLDQLGFITVNHIIWKYQFGVVCKRRFITSHYHCMFVCKNEKKRKFFNDSRYNISDRAKNGGSLRYQDMEDVWTINREYWHGDKKTPTKLPAELVKKILMYTSEQGDIVLDPFLGSGQVAVVSKLLGRRFLGFEIVNEYFRFAQDRLNSGLYRLSDDKRELDDQLQMFGGTK